MPAAISVSDNPTFPGVGRTQVEAYVIDESLDLYGQVVVIEFQEHLRGIEAFASVDALVDRMGEDVARAREVLGARPGP